MKSRQIKWSTLPLKPVTVADGGQNTQLLQYSKNKHFTSDSTAGSSSSPGHGIETSVKMIVNECENDCIRQ